MTTTRGRGRGRRRPSRSGPEDSSKDMWTSGEGYLKLTDATMFRSRRGVLGGREAGLAPCSPRKCCVAFVSVAGYSL